MEFGAVVRTLFSFSREFRLKTGEGDLWGVVHRPFFSSDLVFSDCIGDELVRFVGDGSWFSFSAPIFKVQDPTGLTIGKAAISPELSTDRQTFIFVKNAQGRAVAQLIQERTWISSDTAVHTLVDPNKLGGTTNPHVSPVDPLVDMRVLSLYSAIGFGGGTFFVWGLLMDVLGAAISILVFGLACRKCFGSDQDSFSQIPGEDQSTDLLLAERKQVMQKVAKIEEELAKKARHNRALFSILTMQCCAARSGAPRPVPYQAMMCDPWHGQEEALLDGRD